MDSRQLKRLQLIWVLFGVAALFLTTSLYNFNTDWGWTYRTEPPLWHVIADFLALSLFGILVGAVTTRGVIRLRGKLPNRKWDPGITFGYSLAWGLLVLGATALTLLGERTFEMLGRVLILSLIPVAGIAGASYVRFSRALKSDARYKKAWGAVLGSPDTDSS